MTGDEITPRERGFQVGEDIAERVGRGEIAGDLGTLAAGPQQIPPLLWERIMDEWGIREHLQASPDADAESEFWVGFSSGVRTYLMKKAGATGDSLKPPGPGSGTQPG